MSAPLIYSGRRAKLLTQDGLLRPDGSIIDNNGTPNLIKNGHAEINVTGWTVSKNTVAASRPDSGFVTSSTNITWTRNTTNPIDGQADFLYTKDAANRQGEQVYCGFTVSKKHRAKVLQIEVDYLVNSGTFSAGSSSTDSDVIVYIYDVTNSTFIEPSSFKFLSNSSTIADKFIANFQTSATGSSYRILFHQATTSSSAFAVQFKEVRVSPCQYVYGTPITDWVSYTPTITGLGTPASQSFYTRRVGDSRQVKFVLAAGTTTAALISFTLPNNESIDSNKIAASTVIGKFNANATTWNGSIFKGASNTLVYFGADGTAYTSGYNGNNYANGTTFGGYFEVPITGWSSSTQVSDGYDGRLISASYTYSTTQTITSSDVTLIWNTLINDRTSSMNTSTGVYTAPSSGDYRISANIRLDTLGSASTGHTIKIFKNSTQYVLAASSDLTASKIYNYYPNLTLPLNAGDTVYITASATANNSTFQGTQSAISIEKLSSPTTISATERVSGLRNSTSGQSISANTETTIQYANSEEDTHGMWSTSTHDWTVPVAGRYSVNGFLRTTGAETVTAGQIFRVKLYVDGSYSKEISFIRYLSTVAGTEQAAAFSGEIKLNAGQKVSIVLLSTVACTLSSSAGVNWAGIKLLK